MITFGAIVTTAWVVLFLFIVFCIAGMYWARAKHEQGEIRRRSLLRASILAGLAVAIVLTLALP